MIASRCSLVLLCCGILGLSACGAQQISDPPAGSQQPAPTTTQPAATQRTPNSIPKFSNSDHLEDSHLQELDTGIVQSGTIDSGAVAFGLDNADVFSSVSPEAGPQTHFRLSRAYCDKTSNSTQSASDQAKFFCVPDAITIDDTHPVSMTPNKDFVIAPYFFGMGIYYPGILETYNHTFSVHDNHAVCNPQETFWYDSNSCNAGAQLAVGDNLDLGGLIASAYSVQVNGQLDRSQSFVLLASDSFTGQSHGDMLFAVRDPQDNFRFQFGPSTPGGANDPATMKQFTAARIDSTGKGFFNGGTQTGGADFAESVAVVGTQSKYEPGDVLVIDPEADRNFKLSAEPYSTTVAGIYSTKPGFLGSEHQSEDAELAHEIPMAMIGIVPCNVTTENGPISRGDLLVTSSKPGYAMRATDKSRLQGAVIGKALQPLPKGNGKIEILVTLR